MIPREAIPSATIPAPSSKEVRTNNNDKKLTDTDPATILYCTRSPRLASSCACPGSRGEDSGIACARAQVPAVQWLRARRREWEGHIQRRVWNGEHGMEYSEHARHEVSARLDHEAVHGDSRPSISRAR